MIKCLVCGSVIDKGWHSIVVACWIAGQQVEQLIPYLEHNSYKINLISSGCPQSSVYNSRAQFLPETPVIPSIIHPLFERLKLRVLSFVVLNFNSF